jgi:hypothetical protein
VEAAVAGAGDDHSEAVVLSALIQHLNALGNLLADQLGEAPPRRWRTGTRSDATPPVVTSEPATFALSRPSRRTAGSVHASTARPSWAPTNAECS